MKKINILTDGYFRKNLGDDLFFKILSERYPEVNFCCDIRLGYYSDILRNKKNFIVPKQTKILNPVFSFLLDISKNKKSYDFISKQLWRVYIRLNRNFNRHIDAEYRLIGSAFMESSYGKADTSLAPINLKYANIKNREFSLKNNKVPKFISGANVGPVYSYDFLQYLVKEFENYDDICMRDGLSYNLYSFMPNVRYAPDIVFNLDIEPYKKNIKKKIFVSVIDMEEKLNLSDRSALFYEKTANILDQYIFEGYEINLVSFCKFEGDEYALEKIYDKMSNKNAVRFLYYNGKNLNEILCALGESQYVIAGRFHAMILAMLFEKPFVPICYDDKMYHYLEDLNYNSVIIDAKNTEEITYKNINKNLKNNYLVDVRKHIEDSYLQFEAFDNFLNSFE